MPTSDWTTFLREYRAKHPTLSYRTQLSRASAEYGSKCRPTVLTKKLKTATQAQKDKICEVLNLDTNLKPNDKKSVRHATMAKRRQFVKPGADYYDNPYWTDEIYENYQNMSRKELDRITKAEISQENKTQKQASNWFKKEGKQLKNNPFHVLSTLGRGVTGAGAGGYTGTHSFYTSDHFPKWYIH